MKKTFKIYHPDYWGSDFDDLPTIEAYDAEDAAQEFGEQYDSDGDFTIGNGNAQVFGVKEVGSELPWEFYHVYAEPTVNYYSRQQTLHEIPEDYKKDLRINP